MKNNEFKKVGIKNRTSYYFDDISKSEKFDFYNILLDERSCQNILIYEAFCKTLIGAKPSSLYLIKWMGLLEITVELNI